MRTNIEIDDELLAETMKISGKTSKREAVQDALELFLRIRRDQARIRELYGTVQWEGDLDAMRRDDSTEHRNFLK
ncbi:MAG TPA: type II toxin-antitoxin system VapB family antitoxin [Rhizobiaceae bacterium]|nr:type II toxin-antitoxin system VapB family antitoxin [Rhizobiaceae bacterium]